MASVAFARVYYNTKMDGLAETLTKFEQIHEVHFVTGSPDHLLVKACCESNEALGALLDDINKLDGVRSARAENVVLQTYKYIPMPPA